MTNITNVQWLIMSIEKLDHDLQNYRISFDDYVINMKWVKEQAKAMENKLPSRIEFFKKVAEFEGDFVKLYDWLSCEPYAPLNDSSFREY